MATSTEMEKDILNFMNDSYRKIESVYNPRCYHNRHLDCETLYAYLSGRFPDEPISKCYHVVCAVQKVCSSDRSVYPYPDGEYWTAEEVEKYVAWREQQ